MARSQPGRLLSIMILQLVLGRGETSDESRSTCSPPEKVPVGESAVITFSFFGDFGNKEIAVLKMNAPYQKTIADCYFKDGKRECEEEAGYSFNLTSDMERTQGVLKILTVTEQCEGVYFCQILDVSSLSSSCTLQVSTEKAEVISEVFRQGDYSDDEEVNTTQDPTDADLTSGLSPGAIAGIGASVCLGVVVVAVVVFIKYKRNRREEMGSKSYLQTTSKDYVTSIEKDVQKCISPDDSRSSDSRPGPASPFMKTKV